ncbi:MAG TPA: chemotaxis protein CheA, partial [Candidatus Kapabacteria bacterium]|nr:chemotaxis protein CheA [Candidatus Kapabacteria bacterium]
QPSQPSIAPPQQTKPSTNKEAPKSPDKALSSDTIRIDVNRVEALMDLSGELVLGRNRLAQITEMVEQEFGKNEHVRDLIETTAQIDFVTSEIQAAVMRMRMVPIGKLYQKAPRIVRDLSKEFGKKINLVVKGEETEIDRGIIEELNDPLVHMIRNSCDHGIEPPEERIRIGKPEFGTITLDADQEGNNIVLRISDDGRGMDPEKLKAKALEKGIITHEQAAHMSAREAFQLIFAPGFSTAAKVTAVSGRGVGMDVVRSNIQNLKGMIDIESEVGKGTTFIIKLPLTLAIIQGLLVKVQDETYALPLSSVVEVVAINPDSVYTVSHQEVIRIRQEVIPILRLDRVLGVSNPREELDNRYVVNVGLGMQRIGLVVDELLGQQEIVIKSLGEYLGSITGVAGSTILGDGRVIMIIDVADLIQSIYKNQFMQFGK